MSLEEIDNLKKALNQAQKEKEELELNLHNLDKEKRQMQCKLESKYQQIQKNREAFEKESLKRKCLTEGLLSATFNLDSHNQHLEDVAGEIGKLSRWYKKALQDKKEMEENLRAQIQSLAQASLDQEEKIHYLTMRLQDSQESDVGERLKGMRE